MITAGTSRTKNAGAIAVIGMAGRFPGAPEVGTFWENMVEGRSGITDVPQDRVRSSCLPSQPNYVPKCAVVKDADQFDAAFFGIYPKQAADMDPQHRLFLETCWLALEDAGYTPDATVDRVGVFAGCHMNTYIFCRLAADKELRESLADTFPGGSLTTEISNDKDYLATRVAYQLNLAGPSVAVQSACSTSLVAIAQACESLVSGACDTALSGGVTITFPQEQGYLYTEDSILSPDGICRAFDANARGTIFGDGVGAVVLKRLDDALEDRDSIYAVIKGWGVNNDGGEKAGYTAPSIEGQQAAIELAHRRAGLRADAITYVEAHGTGTQVGDPIEIEALRRAFAKTTDKKQFCRIGSLKTSVGHLDVAAGVAGVIKTCLALQHKQIPPLLNFDAPNPRIDFQNSPFIINDKLTRWVSDQPCRAGVSSFGVGGTNAHIVIEEPPRRSPTEKSSSNFHLLPISARSPASAAAMSRSLATHLADQSDLSLADVASTLQRGRKDFTYRRAIVVRDTQEAVDKLANLDPPTEKVKRNLPITFLFPGQGSQHVNMGRDLYRSDGIFQHHLNAAAEALRPHMDCDLKSLIFASDLNADRLDQTDIAQPALFMVSYALAKWWGARGIQPTSLLGHSVGEFAAAALAGVMSLDEAAMLVAVRGRLMQSLPPGAMLAIRVGENRLARLMPAGLDVAAINAPEMCVLSGPTDLVQSFAEDCDDGKYGDDVVGRELRTSHAFHSRMMDPAVSEFLDVARQVRLQAPQIQMISSVTGEPMDGALATDPEYWARQIREPVRFSNAVAGVLEDANAVLLEVGPGQALTTLTRQQELASSQRVISSLPHAKQNTSSEEHVYGALSQLWTMGAEVQWRSFYQNEIRQRVHLPGYQFERKRYWFNLESDNSESLHETTEHNCGESCSEPDIEHHETSRTRSQDESGVEEALPTHASISPVQDSNAGNELHDTLLTNSSLTHDKQKGVTQTDFLQQLIAQQTLLMSQQIDALRGEDQMIERHSS